MHGPREAHTRAVHSCRTCTCVTSSSLVLVRRHAGLGFERGHGVVIKVLGYENEVPKLSAPLPIKLTKISVGIELGG